MPRSDGFLCADLERTIYAQEKPKEAERDAGLQFIWFNKLTPPKMWRLYTYENQASGRLCQSLSFWQPPAEVTITLRIPAVERNKTGAR